MATGNGQIRAKGQKVDYQAKLTKWHVINNKMIMIIIRNHVRKQKPDKPFTQIIF